MSKPLLTGLSLFTSLLCSSATFAQIRSGAIVGTVTDPSGGPIPSAQVSVVAQETNATFKTQTNATGDYHVPYLQLGRYTVTVTAQGFAGAKISDINVGTAQTVRADVKLELGAVATAVEVSARAVELQTEATSVQGVVNDRLIQAVPNITHNPFYFATLQAGVVPRSALNETQSVNSFGIGIDGRRTFSAIAVNGGQAFTNDIMLDGVSVQGSAWNEAAVLPNPDGIQEVRTIVNNFSAEYGRAQGVITITTKSGSNQFHGSVFDRVRNEAFNANGFSNNARSIPRPAFKVNSYGATVGGPIVKDRAFFFASYEGLTHKRSVDYLRTVPTALEKQGNFSQTMVNVSGLPTPIKLFDPFNVRQVEPNVYQRMPIANAIIPTPDPYALKVMSYYPLPNRTPEDAYNTNNYYLRGPRTFGKNSINSRLDYRRGNHSIYGTGGTTKGRIETPPSWGADNPFFSRNEFIGRYLTDSNPYAAIGDTIVLGPSLVVDLRYGINRINSNNEAAVIEGLDYDQFGIPKDIQAINAVPGAAPEFNPGGGLSALNNTNSLHKRERQTNHGLVGSVTKTVRNWTLKFGAEHRVYLSNYIDAEESVMIQTSGGYTRQLIDATGGGVGTVTADLAGLPAASFLLGAGNLYIAPGRNPMPAFAQKYVALYSQNDWRATSRLTVNLGLRWDLQPGPTERFNRMSAFDYAKQNPFGTPGAFAFAGAGGYGRNLWDVRYRDFGPRFGVAYRLWENTVIRAGYGLTYLPTNTGYFDGPFTYGMDSFADFTNTDPFGPSPAGVLVGRYYQVNSVVRGTGADATYPKLYGGGLQPRFDRTGYLNGTVQQWNMFLERRMGANWLMSAGYTASKGAHLPIARMPVNDDQYLPQALLDTWRSGYIARNGLSNPASEQIPNPLQPSAGPLIPFNGNQGRALITRREAVFPYPHFGSMTVQRSIGWSNYHALVLQVNRNFANGLQMNAHYTWSKSLDFAQTEAQGNGYAETGSGYLGMNLRDYRNSYKLAYTDVPHRLLLTYVYELPFGAGKRFFSANTVAKGIMSGWKIGGVATFQSGFPAQLSGASSGAMNGLPDRIPGVPVEVPKQLQGWYDGKTTVTLPSGRQIRPSAFTYLKYSSDAFRGRVVTTPNGSIVNDIYWFGNSAFTYGDIRGTGLNNWNMSVERTFRPREQVAVEFSAQFTNAFNHTQFRPQMTVALGGTSVLPVGVASNPLNIQPGQGSSSDFGTRGNSTFDPRQIELQLKIRF